MKLSYYVQSSNFIIIIINLVQLLLLNSTRIINSTINSCNYILLILLICEIKLQITLSSFTKTIIIIINLSNYIKFIQYY